MLFFGIIVFRGFSLVVFWGAEMEEIEEELGICFTEMGFCSWGIFVKE